MLGGKACHPATFSHTNPTYFCLLYSFLILAKCQVLNLRVGRSRDQVLQRACSLGLITEKHFRSKHKSCISIFVEGQSSSLLLQYVLLPSGLHLVLWWTCIIICGQFLPRRQFSFHQSRGNYWEFDQQVTNSCAILHAQ